jgi:hypothetical protein
MVEEKNRGEGKKEPKELKYTDVRQDIKQGDILLYKGRTFVSWAIKFFTRSEYSHAGIAAKWNDRLMVMEAIRKGVIVNPLRRSVARYKGSVEWWSLKEEEEINDGTRDEMIRFAQEELGKDFAFLGLFLFALVISFVIPLGKKDRFRREKRLFCSLYVAEIYHKIGKDLKRNAADRFTSPADIANSPLLRYRYTLKYDNGPRTGEKPTV